MDGIAVCVVNRAPCEVRCGIAIAPSFFLLGLPLSGPLAQRRRVSWSDFFGAQGHRGTGLNSRGQTPPFDPGWRNAGAGTRDRA